MSTRLSQQAPWVYGAALALVAIFAFPLLDSRQTSEARIIAALGGIAPLAFTLWSLANISEFVGISSEIPRQMRRRIALAFVVEFVAFAAWGQAAGALIDHDGQTRTLGLVILGAREVSLAGMLFLIYRWLRARIASAGPSLSAEGRQPAGYEPAAIWARSRDWPLWERAPLLFVILDFALAGVAACVGVAIFIAQSI